MRAYQNAGVAWLVQTLADPLFCKGALLADDAGLGKTRTVLEAARGWDAKRVLVLGPAIARNAWRTQVETWTPEWQDRLCIPSADTQLPRTALERPKLILVLSYDQLARQNGWAVLLLQASAAAPWDLLVCDECHYLKTSTSRRTRVVYGHGATGAGGLAAHAKRAVLLSGTPAPNHAGELWTHYRAFWPRRVRAVNGGRPLDETAWVERYTRYVDTPDRGRVIQGTKLQDELRERLGAVVLRRRKRDVLAELPPVVTEDVPLDLAGKAHVDLRGAVDKLVEGLSPEQCAVLCGTAPGPENDQLSTLRRELGELKVWSAAAWIMERIGNIPTDEKLLVFAWHRSVINRLRSYLSSLEPAVISGRTSDKERDYAIERFRTDPKCRLFLGQILAAGTSITLTQASHVVIVEPSWVPAENEQAIARAHRLGQTQPVLVSYLYLPGTIDEAIMRVSRRKADELLRLYDDPSLQTAKEPERAS